MEVSMDRRDFMKTIVATSLISPFILNQKIGHHQSELFLISEEPHKDLFSLLAELNRLNLFSGQKFYVADSHPHQKEILLFLKNQGLLLVPEKKAEIIINFVHLLDPARPSFTLVQEGKIRDLRSSKLYSLWQQMQSRPKTKSLTIASLTPSYPPFQLGKILAVRIEGKVMERLPLAQPVRRLIDTGFGRVILRIEGSRAWVEDSTCRNRICLASSPIKFIGERIICAPNHLVVEIEGRSWLDAVVG